MSKGRLAVISAALAMVATALAVSSPVGAQAAPTCNGKAATIVGTDGNDRIEGTEGNDVIVGGAGDDVIFGRGGNDTICGGDGRDVVKAGRGNDYAEGSTGNDKLIGGIGRDTLDGGRGKDKVFGGGGPDTLIGGSRRDAVRGQNGTDTCDLDHLDVFSTCEAGDVIGMTGMGDTTFALPALPDSFALAGNQFGEFFVVEFFWVADPEAFGPSIAVFAADESLAGFEAPDDAEGLWRFTTFDRPATIEVDGVSYFEVVIVSPEILVPLGLETQGGRPDVFRLQPPTTGPTDYLLTFDGSVGFGGADLELYGPTDSFPDGESTIESTATQLSGTTTEGVRVVAVNGFDWTLSLSEAG